MVVENIYLRKALLKAGCVIIVKTCQKTDGTTKLEYISPNASTIGMNVELINKGLKLPEDYIHPEDREKIVKTISDAVEAKVESYNHQHRIVGDDGNIYNISNEICISDENEEAYKVEMYMKKAKPKKEAPAAPVDKKQVGKEKIDYKRMSENKVLEASMKLFSDLTNLYSTFVNMEGKMIIPPVGPSTNMGDFYDLFEKPAYKEYFKVIKQTVLSNDEAVVMDREEGGIGKMCAAPIKSNGEVAGLWILGSYTSEETARLNEVCDKQWLLADMISDYMEKTAASSLESAKAKGAGVKLREELARQGIINDALSKVNSSIIDSVDQIISETFRDVGMNMDVDKMLLYMDSPTIKEEYALANYWSADGSGPGEEFATEMARKKYIFLEAFEDGETQLVVDSSNMTETFKLTLMHYGIKAIIVRPVYIGKTIKGVVIFAECKSERVWTSEEARFSKSITLVIQNMLDAAYGDGNIRNVNNLLLETYNSFKVGIFVRDEHSGEVLFANKAMNEMLGYDFVGRDSREIIVDLHDRFDDISAMRKPFITKNTETKWRSYIQKLDAIMDITELKLEWTDGQPASFIILRKAKDTTN